MKKMLNELIDKLKSIKVNGFIQCLCVALVSCTAVLAGAAVFGTAGEVKNGQGGFETRGMPVIQEELKKDAENVEKLASAAVVNDEMYYQVYRVRKGDMIGHIAEKFGVTQDSIISVNDVHSSRNLQIGTYLKIPSAPGILYTVRKDGETLTGIAQKYEVELAKCAAINTVDAEAALKAGDMVFVPGGKLSWAELQEINGDLFKKPIHAAWYRTSNYGWRSSPFNGSRSFHSGIDMACPTGTKIYAALEGNVTSTGFSNVYGNFVIVAHHSGYSTLYAHMSKIEAKKDQYVNKNTVLGRVGSTGMSTGPHLHFTVYKRNKTVNPVNLWN